MYSNSSFLFNTENINTPSFGGNGLFLSDDITIYSILYPLFQKVSQRNVLKIGILDLNDSIFDKSPFDAIKNRFVKNLDQYIQSININQEIRDRIIALSSSDSFEKIEIMLKKFFSMDSLFNLFYDNNKYRVTGQKALRANKYRRNDLNDADSNVKKALIPDIKIEFLRKNLEIVTVEQAKSEDVKKEKNDTTKLCTCLHDMIRQVYNILPQSMKGSIRNIKVFGLIISRVDVTIYELELPEQQLYVFRELCSFSLPLTFADFRSMLEVTMNFIKFRKLVDDNLEKMEAALVIDLNKAKSSPLSSHVDDENTNFYRDTTPPPQSGKKWLVNIEISPSSKSLKSPIIRESLKRYNDDIGLEDAVHTSILTLKEGFEGQMTENSIEIGIIGGDTTGFMEGKEQPLFRKLSPSEVKDYLANIA
ncbi:12484_t:CDS:2 [Entrophospora sp. SA101]|nr:21031_t:CDS:2 [Entrophospora sp. SA101]CAJ0891032.1 12484_t:CDS:2 [Entrophospora sp. SA101]